MKKRNMLTKVAALSMAALMTVTGLPVAGLDGALATEAKDGGLGQSWIVQNDGTTGLTSLSPTKVGDYIDLSVKTGAAKNALGSVVTGNWLVASPAFVISGGAEDDSTADVASKGAATSIRVTAVTPAAASVITAQAAWGEDTGDATTINAPVVARNINNDSSVKVKLGVVDSGDTPDASGWTAYTGTGIQSLGTKSLSGKGYDIILSSITVGTADLPVTDDFKLEVTGVDTGTPNGNHIVTVDKAGKYNVAVKSVSNNGRVYGERNFSFEISTVSMNNNNTDITITTGQDTPQYSVNGAKIAKTDITVKYDNNPIGNNFDVSYTGNTKAGVATATLTVTPDTDKTGLTGSATKTYTVLPKNVTNFTSKFNTSTGENGKFVVTNLQKSNGGDDTSKIASQIYTGNAIQPDLDIYDAEIVDEKSSLYSGAYAPDTSTKDLEKIKFTKLVKGQDYKLTYGENTKVGSASGTINISGIGNYKGDLASTITFAIVDPSKSIANNAKATMKVAGNDGQKIDLANGGSVKYTGAYILPDITVVYTDPDTLNTTTLTATGNGTDKNNSYTNVSTGISVSADANKKVGTATITIVGTSEKFAGELKLSFAIEPKDIADVNVGLATSSLEYTGAALKPELSQVKNNVTSSEDLVEGKDYSCYYDNNVNAGKATVTLAGMGNYTGTKTVDYTITPYNITSSKIAIKTVANQVFTGSEITPDIDAEFTLQDGAKKALVAGSDYTLAYRTNTGSDSQKSTAYIDITGIGNFQGTGQATFQIVPSANDLSNAEITLYNDSYAFDDAYHTAAVKTVKVGETYLTSSDYELVKTVSVKDVGEYDVEIRGTSTSNYGGIGSTKFTITAKEATVDFALSATKKTYNGKAQTVTVKDVTRDGVAITEDEYTVSGTTKATNAGKNTVTVTLKGNYSGSAKKTWTIAKAKQTIKVSPTSKTFKASKVKKAKQTFTIKVTGAKGTKSFKSNSKKVTVTKAGKVTVKKGTKKGTYKITVKAAATKNYNAAASKTVTIKVK